MTEEIRAKANELAEEIEKTKSDLCNCKIMLENQHKGLFIKSSIGYSLPDDIARGVLQLSKDAIERKLEKIKKEYNEL